MPETTPRPRPPDNGHEVFVVTDSDNYIPLSHLVHEAHSQEVGRGAQNIREAGEDVQTALGV